MNTIYISNDSSQNGVEKKKAYFHLNQNLETITQEHSLDGELQPGTKVCFNVFYYFGFIPFKITWSDASKSYCAYSTSLAHRTICAIVHALIFVNSILEIKGLFNAKISENPSLFFIIAERLLIVSCYLAFLELVWLRKHEVLGILISTSDVESKSKLSSYKVRMFAKLLWTAWISWSAFIYLSNIFYPDIYGGYRSYIQRISSEFNSNSLDFENKNMAIEMFALLLFACRMYKWILTDAIALLTIIMAVVCWRVARQFKTSLQLQEDSQIPSNTNVEKIFIQYTSLKNYFDKTNQVFGTFYVVSFLATVTTLPRGIIELMDTDGWVNRLCRGIYLLLFTPIYLLLAEAHYQICYFKTWLLSRPMNSFQDIGNYMAVEKENLGIRGGRFFTITYSLVGTAASVVLTYTIINLQFHGTKNN